jgi:hypothetical protein
MAWGAFCGELKSNLVFVSNRVSIDSATYTLEILDPFLIPFWHETCERYGWTEVVEDNAPGHKKWAKICRQKNAMESLAWCPQSPDLNLIEHLWADMECYLGERYGRIGDINVLCIALNDAWERIGWNRLDSLIRSMPERIRAVIAADGGPTRY